MQLLFLALAMAVSGSAAADEGTVIRSPVAAEAAGEQLLTNGDLEVVEGQGFAGFEPWELGCEVDAEVFHSAGHSARCSNASADEHRGLTYVVELDQDRPVPILAELWSRAQDVSGARDADYSLYLDLEYTDGTPLWGQIKAFKTGTHDWQRARVAVYPQKPIKKVSVHGIFRRHTGTAWFDDFKLWEIEPPEGAAIFDGIVSESVPVTAGPVAGPTITGGDGLSLQLDAAGGALLAPGTGGFLLRDVAGESAFVRPTGPPERLEDGTIHFRGEATSLGLELEADYRALDGALRIDGVVRDTTGGNRAVTVYFTYPLEAVGGKWHDDQRTSREIAATGEYASLAGVEAGALGMASRYPLGCVSTAEEAVAIAAPLDVPRLWRFGYAASFGELYGAVDLGLSPLTRNFPSSASFSLLLYRCDPKWGFRSALQRYYELCPSCFAKRNDKEGIWMPFTDIATVAGFEDFGFQFKEGNNNVPFDEAQGIYSFVYVEPMSHWLAMPEEMERSDQRAQAFIREKAAAGDRQSQATLTSAIADQDGDWHGGITVAPWCDGALYILNPAPSVEESSPETVTQFRSEWASIESAFRNAGGQQGAWRPWVEGYEVAQAAGRDGSGAIRLVRKDGEEGARGASQTVVLNQTEPEPLVARAWTKAENVTGEPGPNYSLYIDLTYADGTTGWGFVVPAKTGTHDWELLQQTITPPKPVTALSYHLLLRPPHTGTAWFDDASLVLQGGEENLLESGDFEPTADVPVEAVLDGTYIDSLEMGASTLNYRPEHLREAQIPLVFDTEGEPCELMLFNTVAFAREVATRMWADGKMMFANSTPIRFPWAAAWLDVMGIETNWALMGDYMPNDDATMCYRRALSAQRPYLLLLNTVYDDFKPEWMELYFKRCTAYGIHPGMFSHNAADEVYFSRPNLYNRDRPLFLKYIPVINALNGAGFEPVTYAVSDNEKVYVERFGKVGGELYLTLFNDSDEMQRAKVTPDEGLGAVTAVEDVLNGGEVARAADGSLSVALEPEDVLVLRVR